MSSSIDRQSNSTASLVALVLAGGKSSRMGRDKTLILWEGKPILERVCQTAATCCQQVYILTPWPERYRATLNGSYYFLEESNQGQGPLVAFAEGLEQIGSHCHTDWILLLACDLPRLDGEILRSWATQLNRVPAKIMAVVPQQSTGWEPLCGFYRLGLKPALQNFIEEGGRSFQFWLSHLSVQAIPVEEQAAKMLHNCNTPEDLLRS